MKKLLEKYLLAGLTAALLAVSPLAVFPQAKWHVPPDPPDSREKAPVAERPPALPLPYGGETYEKSIAADPNVNLTLCVVQGNLRINGWRRNEVRVFVRDGSRLNFNVREKSADGKPVWISAVGYDPKKVNKAFPDCIWGEEIEIDVPVGATIEVKGQETRTSVDTVKKLAVRNIGGDITARNISGGVLASTYEGDIVVENSKGGVSLESTTGNIVAFETGPSAIGDIFRAKTNGGAISLQNLEHRQVDVNSISGSIFFNGSILSGGVYSLSTSSGSIRMALPMTTSCQIIVVYGYGAFSSPDIVFKMETENISPGPVKKAVGKLGKGGDAILKLSTQTGSIVIKKR
jgi:hypothetical protein